MKPCPAEPTSLEADRTGRSDSQAVTFHETKLTPKAVELCGVIVGTIVAIARPV